MKQSSPESQPQKLPHSKKKLANDYATYSALGIQMGVTIAAFAFAGQWLDRRTHTPKPYWTSAFALLGVLFALYFLFKAATPRTK